MKTTSTFTFIHYSEVKSLINSNTLKAIGTNLYQVNPSNQFTINKERTKIYIHKSSNRQSFFHLIATK